MSHQCLVFRACYFCPKFQDKSSFCQHNFYQLLIVGKCISLTGRIISILATDISFVSVFVHLCSFRPTYALCTISSLAIAEYSYTTIAVPSKTMLTSSLAPQCHQPRRLSASQLSSSGQSTTYLLHSFCSQHKRVLFLHTNAILNANAHTAKMNWVRVCVGNVDTTVCVFSAVCLSDLVGCKTHGSIVTHCRAFSGVLRD